MEEETNYMSFVNAASDRNRYRDTGDDSAYYHKTNVCTGSFVWNSTRTSTPGVRSVTVIAKECPMIFSKAVGVLSLNDFDILDARSYRQNSSTLGAFKVKALPGSDSEKERFVRAEQQLKDVLDGRMNLNMEFRKKMSARTAGFPNLSQQASLQVEIDNESSFLFTLIEVKTDDFPGVLFAVSDAILKSGLDIWNAGISTVNGKICDTFYVKDQNGKKIMAEDEIAAIRSKMRTSYSMMR